MRSSTAQRETRAHEQQRGGGHGQRSTGASRLITAIVSGDVTEVHDLLEQGVSPDASMYGRTAVVWAVMQGQCDVLAALLNAGADPLTRSTSGRTAMDVAETLRCSRSIELLAGAVRRRLRAEETGGGVSESNQPIDTPVPTQRF